MRISDWSSDVCSSDLPEAVARYTEGPKRFVPGLDGLHRMTGLLLAERVPENADILVLGAGGGSEMKAMAKAHPGWRFTGVDPAGPMLDLASKVLGANAHRADLIEGTIDDAPAGPFDGRSEEHTSELKSLLRISYAVFC